MARSAAIDSIAWTTGGFACCSTLMADVLQTSNDKGFTLLELLMVLLCSSLLWWLAIPAYQRWFTETHLNRSVGQMLSAIEFARSEAIKRQTLVTLCKSHDGQHCGGRWQDGWIVFASQKTSGRFEPGDILLRHYSKLAAQQTLRWQGSRSKNYLQISPTGATHGQNGSFIFCKDLLGSKMVWAIKVSQTGRLRVEKGLSERQC